MAVISGHPEFGKPAQMEDSSGVEISSVVPSKLRIFSSDVNVMFAYDNKHIFKY
jgi:hypothetical protein